MKHKEKYALTKKEKAKETNQKKKFFCMVTSVFSRRCESYMM